jgi:hypothetical protein
MTFNEATHKLVFGSRGILIPLLLLWLAGCGGQRLPGLPQQLVGEWRTTEVQHAGRSIRVETSSITFGMGGAGPDQMERVEVVRLTTLPEGEEYKINLRKPDGTPDTLNLDFTQQNGGELRLKNQPKVVWRTGKEPAPVRVAPLGSQTQQAPIATLPLNGTEHKTIYRVDCLRPDVCKSY